MAISSDSQQSGKKSLENGLSANSAEEETDKARPDDQNDPKLTTDTPSVRHDFGPNFIMLPTNNQIKELQTVLRDK